MIGKLQKPGAGPPGREAAVSEDEKKAMMAYYFKKQVRLALIVCVATLKTLSIFVIETAFASFTGVGVGCC